MAAGVSDRSMSPGDLPRAASVVLLRGGAAGDAGRGFEVYLLRRPGTARFAPGAATFPGGVLDEADRDLARALLDGPDAAACHALHDRLGGDHLFAAPDAATSVALLVCAARELFEETGVLLAWSGDGPTPAAAVGRRQVWRDALLAGSMSFAALLEDAGLRLRLDDPIAFSHWITPEGRPIRYNTHFFLGVLPPGQAARHDARESDGGQWLTPAAALARHARGDLPMLPVQQAHLERFASFDTLAALLDHARVKAIPPVLPVVDPDGRRVALVEEIARCW